MKPTEKKTPAGSHQAVRAGASGGRVGGRCGGTADDEGEGQQDEQNAGRLPTRDAFAQQQGGPDDRQHDRRARGHGRDGYTDPPRRDGHDIHRAEVEQARQQGQVPPVGGEQGVQPVGRQAAVAFDECQHEGEQVIDHDGLGGIDLLGAEEFERQHDERHRSDGGEQVGEHVCRGVSGRPPRRSAVCAGG